MLALAGSEARADEPLIGPSDIAPFLIGPANVVYIGDMAVATVDATGNLQPLGDGQFRPTMTVSCEDGTWVFWSYGEEMPECPALDSLKPLESR